MTPKDKKTHQVGGFLSLFIDLGVYVISRYIVTSSIKAVNTQVALKNKKVIGLLIRGQSLRDPPMAENGKTRLD